MKFIRIHGRVVPIREKGEQPGKFEKGATTVATGAIAVSGYHAAKAAQIMKHAATFGTNAQHLNAIKGIAKSVGNANKVAIVSGLIGIAAKNIRNNKAYNKARTNEQRRALTKDMVKSSVKELAITSLALAGGASARLFSPMAAKAIYTGTAKISEEVRFRRAAEARRPISGLLAKGGNYGRRSWRSV